MFTPALSFGSDSRRGSLGPLSPRRGPGLPPGPASCSVLWDVGGPGGHLAGRSPGPPRQSLGALPLALPTQGSALRPFQTLFGLLAAGLPCGPFFLGGADVTQGTPPPGSFGGSEGLVKNA